VEPDKQQAAKSILKEVKQRWGDGALYTSSKAADVQRIPMRYAVLDAMLGGIPRGHITELIGGLTSGITTFALELASTVQAQAEPVVYLDLVDDQISWLMGTSSAHEQASREKSVRRA
jgi:RecA/RadA recombinase